MTIEVRRLGTFWHVLVNNKIRKSFSGEDADHKANDEAQRIVDDPRWLTSNR